MHEPENIGRAAHISGMSYLVYKRVNGRYYAYLQRSYRVGKKVTTESVYIGPASGPTSQGAAEHGRLQRLLAERNNIEADLYRMRHAADIREGRYQMGRPSREFREQGAQKARREAAERELNELQERSIPQGKPNNEDEVALADRIERWQEWYDRAVDQYNAMSTGQVAVAGQSGADDEN